MKTLNFITGNKNKLAEVQAILGDAVDITNVAVGVPEIQGTIEEIAKEKARKAAEAVNGPALTEDTALEFTALNGLPGPYIKHFVQSIGLDGLNKLVQPYEDKTCTAVCTFAFCSGPGAEPILFQGRTQGRVVPARGPTNFGWDPIFEYDGHTFAEMDKVEKNKISHRSKALSQLREWLKSQA